MIDIYGNGFVPPNPRDLSTRRLVAYYCAAVNDLPSQKAATFIDALLSECDRRDAEVMSLRESQRNSDE